MLIIASAGQNTTEDVAKKMILVGADVIRFNFARRSVVENIQYIQNIKEAITNLNSTTKIMIDLPFGKIRLGDFDIKVFAVRENEEFLCKSASYSPDCNEFIPVQVTKLGEKVRLNQTITIGDGEVAMQITEVLDPETIRVKILNNGVLYCLKTFNISEYQKDLDKVLDKYREIIGGAKEIAPNFIAVSYFNDDNTDKGIKNIISQEMANKPVRIIIKIDNRDSVQNIEKIIADDFYNYIMIDRGELGVNMPYEQLGIIQKNICRIARQYKKPVIVSTQILESTINYYTPNRSEILDLTNMIVDGVFGIMLCRETGIGSRPAYAITVAKKIIEAAERRLKSPSA